MEKQMNVLVNSDHQTAFVYCCYYFHGLDPDKDGIAPRTDISLEYKAE